MPAAGVPAAAAGPRRRGARLRAAAAVGVDVAARGAVHGQGAAGADGGEADPAAGAGEDMIQIRKPLENA